jgi:hypothetical protein
MHPNKGVDTDDETDEGINEEKHILIDKCISFTTELIQGLKQKSFISVGIQNTRGFTKKSLNA